VCEADTLGDVTLQAFYGSLEEGLFVLVEVGEWVVGLLCSGSLFHCLVNVLNSYESETYT
jgi:hypothetical protein